MCSVADPYHFDADPDPDPACHFDPDPDPSSQIKAQNFEVLKKAHFSYILACNLKIDPVPDPTYHFGPGSGSSLSL